MGGNRRVEPEIDPAALDLALAEAQRGMEEAAIISERHHERMMGLLRLGIAETAGVIAVVGLVLNLDVVVPGRAAVLFTGGIVMATAGMATAVLALSGIILQRTGRVAADPREMAMRLIEPGTDRVVLQWGLLQRAGRYLEALEGRELAYARALAVVSWTILAASACYLLGIGYIALGAINA